MDWMYVTGAKYSELTTDGHIVNLVLTIVQILAREPELRQRLEAQLDGLESLTLDRMIADILGQHGTIKQTET